MSCVKCNPEASRLLKDICILDFTLVELALYLDTHEKDKNALEYYLYYCRLKKKLEMEFSKKYYPLCLNLVDECDEWNWAEAPLPWEGVF